MPGFVRAVRRGCALVAVLAAVAPVAPADASESVLTVSAARSASVDVTFARAVTLDTGKTTMTGGGSYAGYYVQPLGSPGDRGVGVVQPAAFQGGPFAPFPVPLGLQGAVRAVNGGQGHRLPAGRYRLHVLADGPATVRMVLRGAGPRRALRATGRSAFFAATRDLTPPVPAPVADAPELVVAVPSGFHVTVVAVYIAARSVYPAGAMTYNACIGPQDVPARCHAGPYAPGNPDFENKYTYTSAQFTLPIPVVWHAGAVATYYPRGTAPPGEQFASYQAATDGLVDAFAVVAFSLAF